MARRVSWKDRSKSRRLDEETKREERDAYPHPRQLLDDPLVLVGQERLERLSSLLVGLGIRKSQLRLVIVVSSSELDELHATERNPEASQVNSPFGLDPSLPIHGAYRTKRSGTHLHNLQLPLHIVVVHILLRLRLQPFNLNRFRRHLLAQLLDPLLSRPLPFLPRTLLRLQSSKQTSSFVLQVRDLSFEGFDLVDVLGARLDRFDFGAEDFLR